LRENVGSSRKSLLQQGALLLVGLFLIFVAVLLLRSAIAPPLGDFEEWTYHGVLLRNVLQGHPDPAYLLKTYPVPNSLTTVGLGVLMLFLPWQIAAKVWLLAGAALGLFCANRLQRAAGEQQSWKLLLLPAAILFGSTFWFGFNNFTLATYLSMLFGSLLLRHVESRWMYSALLVLVFFCHMIPLGFCLLLLGLYSLQQRSFRLLWQTIPSLLLCGWYFIGRMQHGDADGSAGMVASVRYMTPLFAAFKANTYLKCWGFINPALGDKDSLLLRLVGTKLFLLLFVLNLIVAVTVLVLGVRAAQQSLQRRNPALFFWIAIAIFTVVALLMPGAAAGVSDPGGRMMQVAAWCAMCLVVTRARWCSVLLTICALALMSADGYLLAKLVTQPPQMGAVSSPLPTRLREFGHVYYGAHWGYYGNIEHHQMDQPIYPTALFLPRTQR
jgi:hypothetical protein